jgi:hypothetical protein
MRYDANFMVNSYDLPYLRYSEDPSSCISFEMRERCIGAGFCIISTKGILFFNYSSSMLFLLEGG